MGYEHMQAKTDLIFQSFYMKMSLACLKLPHEILKRKKGIYRCLPCYPHILAGPPTLNFVTPTRLFMSCMSVVCRDHQSFSFSLSYILYKHIRVVYTHC